MILPLHPLYGGCVAQSVEHIPFKDGVLGSNPSATTKASKWAPFFIPPK